MKYFIAIDGKAQGPFTQDEVKAMKPSWDTLIWKEGDPDWKKAGVLPDLASLYTQATPTPPPIPAQDPLALNRNVPSHHEPEPTPPPIRPKVLNQAAVPAPKPEAPSFYDQYHTTTKPPGFFSTPRAKWIGGIVGALLLWWIAAIIFSGGSSSSSTSSSSDYSTDEASTPGPSAKRDLYSKGVTWTFRPLRKEIEVTGYIENRSEIYAYTNPVVKIVLFDANGGTIGTYERTESYEVVFNSTVGFDLTVPGTKWVDKVKVFIVGGQYCPDCRHDI